MSMGTFTNFLIHRLPLHEVSEYFPTTAMNDLFRKEVDRSLAQEDLDDGIRQDLERLRALNLVGYVDSSVRRSGVREAEIDETVHDILVRFLVSPGSLFRKWDGKSPMTARLKVAIKNSLITVAKKRQKRAKRFRELPDNVALTPCTDFHGTIEVFRDALRGRYGDAHVRVFDVRMAGGEIKQLIGSEGIPTSYSLKKIVADIKSLVVGWGDECLQRAVAGMVARENETLAKRFQRNELEPVKG
jgi:hypothetical protein